MQLCSALCGEAVGLLIARRVFMFETLDPSVLEKSPNSSVQCARTESDTSFTQRFHILEQSVAVFRF
jgi:hypothetical protein